TRCLSDWSSDVCSSDLLAFRFLYNSAAFWLLDYRGVVTLSVTFSLFFSGMILPLALFPVWLKTIAHALPFQSIIQVPIDVYLGKDRKSTRLNSSHLGIS